MGELDMGAKLVLQAVYIGELEAEVERLRGALKSARDWMIQVDQDASGVASGTTRVLSDLNTALEPSP